MTRLKKGIVYMTSAFVLSEVQKNELRMYLAQLFFAFSRQNWLRGNSFAMARHCAIKQIEMYLGAKDKKTGPVIDYLKDYFNQNKNFMYKLTLNTKKAEMALDLSIEKMEFLKKDSIKSINKTLSKLKELIDCSDYKTQTILKYGLNDAILSIQKNKLERIK